MSFFGFDATLPGDSAKSHGKGARAGTSASDNRKPMDLGGGAKTGWRSTGSNDQDDFSGLPLDGDASRLDELMEEKLKYGGLEWDDAGDESGANRIGLDDDDEDLNDETFGSGMADIEESIVPKKSRAAAPMNVTENSAYINHIAIRRRGECRRADGEYLELNSSKRTSTKILVATSCTLPMAYNSCQVLMCLLPRKRVVMSLGLESGGGVNERSGMARKISETAQNSKPEASRRA